MKTALWLLALASAASAADDKACLEQGDQVTLQGRAHAEPLTMANGTKQQVWIFETAPVCVEAESTTRFQLIGKPPPAGKSIELVGVLSTRNVTQYYAVPNALTVTSGKVVPAPVQAPAPTTQQLEGIDKEIAEANECIEFADRVIANQQAIGREVGFVDKALLYGAGADKVRCRRRLQVLLACRVAGNCPSDPTRPTRPTYQMPTGNPVQ